MNKIIIILLTMFFCINFNITVFGTVKYRQVKNKKIIQQIKNIEYGFNLIIRNNKKYNDNVMKVYSYVYNKINKGEISISIDAKIPKDIYGGFQFMAADPKLKRKTHIVLSPFILDYYDKYPSIFYSALIHEFKHAYDYYTIDNFIHYQKHDPMEQYLFQMDAVYLEGLFIRDYLHNSGISLSNYEKVILKSISENDLNYFSYIIMGFDMDVAHELYGVYNSKDNYSKKIDKINSIGRKILKSFVFPEKDNQWKQYVSLVSPKTFIYFTPSLASKIIEYSHRNKTPLLLESDEVKKLKTTLELLKNRVKNYTVYESFHNKILDYYRKL